MKLLTELFHDLCDLIELVNSTFTFQLLVTILSLLLTNIFAFYGTLREFLAGSNGLGFFIIGNGIWTAIQYFIMVFMAHAGSSTKSEADKSSVIIAKASGTLDAHDYLKTALHYLLIEMRCRNTALQNIFFAINWNVILAVRYLYRPKVYKVQIHFFTISVYINDGDISHNHMSIRLSNKI